MNAMLKTFMALTLAVSLLTLGASPILASERLVDEKAELALMPKVPGVEGYAVAELRIDEADMLELFRIKVVTAGLVPGGTYTLWWGKYLIATGIADNNGRLSFDERITAFHPKCLVGGKIKVFYGTTMEAPKVLFGEIMKSDLK